MHKNTGMKAVILLACHWISVSATPIHLAREVGSLNSASLLERDGSGACTSGGWQCVGSVLQSEPTTIKKIRDSADGQDATTRNGCRSLIVKTLVLPARKYAPIGYGGQVLTIRTGSFTGCLGGAGDVALDGPTGGTSVARPSLGGM